jgi:predicted kinase
MDRALLVIVTGAPASGKTTIARGLAAELEIIALYKDEIKERLGEEIPGEGVDWSRSLGRAAYALLDELAEKLLSAGYACLIEANFHPELSLPGLSRLAASASVVQVVCQADPDVLERRYRQRFEDGSRNAVHLDLAAGRNAELAAAFRRDHALPLSGELIRIDTTAIETLDLAGIAGEIRVLDHQKAFTVAE